MAIIKIVSDINKVIKKTEAVKRQIPFAASRALNSTAFDIRDNIRDQQLPGLYTLRNRFTQRSVRVQLSKKTNLNAAIYSDAYYMREQASGMVRTPRGEAFAVPISKQWKNKRRRIPKRIRPDTIMTSGKGFIGKTKAGGEAIVMRTTKKRRPSLVTMYSLKKSVRIPRTLRLNEIVPRIAPAAYPRHFQRELTNAMRTAR